MKKTYQLLCFLFLTLPVAAFAITDWITSVVDGRVSVQAPIQLPEIDIIKILSAQGASKEQLDKMKLSKIFAAKDAAGTYMVFRLDVNGPEFNGKNLPAGTLKDYYDGLISGVLRNEHGVLLERSAFTTSGYEGIDFKYKGIHKGTGKMVIKCARGILLENTSYTLTFVPADNTDSTGVSGNTERTRFYNSVTIKPATTK